MRYTQRALCIVLFVVLSAGTASAQFGLYAGANFNQLSDIDDDAAGYHVGLFFDLGAGPVGLRVGAHYMDVGAFEVECVTPSVCTTETFDLALVEVPVDLRVHVAATPLVRPYVLAGPVFRLATTSTDAFDDSLNEFSFAGNAGIGVKIGVPGGVALYSELRLGFGLSRITDGFEVQGTEFVADDGQHLSTWMVRVGVSF